MVSPSEADLQPPYLGHRFAPSNTWEVDERRGLERKYSQTSTRPREYSLITKCLAEFVGDLTFVFVGTMQAANTGTSDGITHAALAHGFTIFILVSALGHISGGHFNPAVSWAIAGAGKMPIWHLPFYIGSQLFGGFCGALLTASILTQKQITECGAGATLLAGNQWWQGLISETIVTFFLVHTILNVAVDTDKNILAPLAIGLTLSIDILATGSITGASMNPARSLGPNIVAQIFIPNNVLPKTLWTYHYIYYVGPLAGSTIALVIHKLFEAREDRFVN